MAVDHIRYDLLAQEALRGVVRTVIADTAKNGLPGEHHFYVSFNTRAEGVEISARMLTQYPKEMTVVLQHQFWDLVVDAEHFEVGLSFGGIPERLSVPFAAVTRFYDPSVQFGLQFEEMHEDAAEEPAPPPKARDPKAKRPPAEHKSSPPKLTSVPTPANPPPGDGPDKPAGGGEVVRFDRFRKK